METRARFIFQMKALGHYVIYHVVARNSTDARARLTKFFKEKERMGSVRIAQMQACLDLVDVKPI